MGMNYDNLGKAFVSKQNVTTIYQSVKKKVHAKTGIDIQDDYIALCVEQMNSMINKIFSDNLWEKEHLESPKQTIVDLDNVAVKLLVKRIGVPKKPDPLPHLPRPFLPNVQQLTQPVPPRLPPPSKQYIPLSMFTNIKDLYTEMPHDLCTLIGEITPSAKLSSTLFRVKTEPEIVAEAEAEPKSFVSPLQASAVEKKETRHFTIQNGDLVQFDTTSLELSLHGDPPKMQTDYLYFSENDEEMKTISIEYMDEMSLLRQLTTCTGFRWNVENHRLVVSSARPFSLLFEQTRGSLWKVLGFEKKNYKCQSEYRGKSLITLETQLTLQGIPFTGTRNLIVKDGSYLVEILDGKGDLPTLTLDVTVTFIPNPCTMELLEL